jgi:CheY-like chemotaxis protein
LAAEYQPDGILLDLKLPDHSGLSVLDRLKQSAKTRHIPVHVISAEDQSRTALEMGAVGFLKKPPEPEALRGVLDELERRITQKIRQLLIVEDDPHQRLSVKKLIGNGDVHTVAVGTASEALEQLKQNTYDCMIVDLSLPDLSGFELLEKISDDEQYGHPPVIVYTGRSLSREEEERLRKFSKSIIIKGAKSPERLLSEVSLFLHRVESHLPVDRQRMLQELRNREKIFEARTILLVDDDVRNIFALGSALEKKGARVEIARNGLEALAKLEQNPGMDLVLMDIMMPEMDGLTATREIRKQGRFRDLPIIAVTAKAMSDDRQQCLDAGANDYLAKPVDLEKLLSLIRVWLPTAPGRETIEVEEYGRN